jgi:hypothetical protein
MRQCVKRSLMMRTTVTSKSLIHSSRCRFYSTTNQHQHIEEAQQHHHQPIQQQQQHQTSSPNVNMLQRLYLNYVNKSDTSNTNVLPPVLPLPKKIQKTLKKSAEEKYTEEIGEKAVIRSIIGNTLITSLKFLAYATSGSAAMLSEGFHSLIDSINQGLLYFGLKQAKKQPDSMYQYGYGRAPYFWSLVSAMGIFWMGFGLVG